VTELDWFLAAFAIPTAKKTKKGPRLVKQYGQK
jgi:hypothetical protein